MFAIIFIMGIKYACNLKSKRNYLCLQSLSKWTRYACNVENSPKVTWLWFLDEYREQKILMIASIFGPHGKKWQAYMVRFGFKIAVAVQYDIWPLIFIDSDCPGYHFRIVWFDLKISKPSHMEKITIVKYIDFQPARNFNPRRITFVSYHVISFNFSPFMQMIQF